MWLKKSTGKKKAEGSPADILPKSPSQKVGIFSVDICLAHVCNKLRMERRACVHACAPPEASYPTDSGPDVQSDPTNDPGYPSLDSINMAPKTDPREEERVSALLNEVTVCMSDK